MTRYRRVAADVLRRELLDLLLDDHPTPEAIDALQAAGVEYDPWFQFGISLREAAALRVQHRTVLIAEAERRHLGGADYLDRVCEKCWDAWRLSRPSGEGSIQ